MRYEQIFNKMPQSMLELISGQAWCRTLIEQGEKPGRLLSAKIHLTKLHRQMSVAELHTLRLILSAFGCEPFSKEALEKQAAARMAGAEVTVGLIGLRKVGVIVAFRKAWGEQLYVLPEDGFRAWQELLYPDFLIQTIADDRELELLDIAATSPRGLAQQLLHFFVACSQQPGLPLTNKGTLHKKQLQKLSEQLVLPRELFQATGLSYAFRDVYDENIAILLEMAIRLEVLVHIGDRYHLDHEALFKWLRLPYDTQQAELYIIWRSLLLPAPAWLQHGISLMECLSTHDWFSLDDIVTSIHRCSVSSNPYDVLAIRNALMEQWIKPLCAFRWLKLGVDAQGGIWFHYLISALFETPNMNEEGSTAAEIEAQDESKAERSLYVQPDFELLLPPNVSLYEEWQIAAFADLQSSDLVRTYRMTKDSFHRASENGTRSEAILRFLHNHACYGVPEHVEITLQQWDQQSGKLQLKEVNLLQCESAEVAAVLLRNEKCSRFLQNRIGDSHFIVEADHLADLRKCLEQMGYHPRGIAGNGAKSKSTSSVARQTDAVESTFAPAKLQGLFYSRDTIQLYEIDSALPEWDDLYPDMQDIPSLWLKEFRDYHGSTRKEMIRKAIEWKSCLRLRKEGRNRLIIPRAIYEERSGWTLFGLEEDQEIMLKSEDWEEMQLILPGINDQEKPTF
ncbi:helicase-associated domain-containing protein [Paenibacillus sedimenti]|uniref:Helicase-associated domain-containing protein n=1 Tax=Paenibacillus sedimenti TaxID=2770274 RepID=A0A926KNM0_9BACL|nr:helicase-associated domain-containing protein [Paenibacillus sedimenti]MBD0379325.1 helicase-associated domain-containing protein [Paenibacillus sedimenti]